jgi:hypothetical protein
MQTALRADGTLALVPRPPYGPSLAPTGWSRDLRNHFQRTLAGHHDRIDFAADYLGDLGLSEAIKGVGDRWLCTWYPDQQGC